jgi:hypothetical protein
MGTPRAWSWLVSLANQPQASYSWTASTLYGKDELKAWNYTLMAGLAVRAAPRWQFQVSPQYSRSVEMRQYLSTVAGGPATTYGSRYVFAAIERSTISTQLRLNYAFTPDLTLEGYAEPFAASGRFYNVGELSAPRSRDLRLYGTGGTSIARRADGAFVVTEGTSSFTIPNPDFNRLSLRSNVVLRWEWRPASTLFLIWQQNRQQVTPAGMLVRPGSLWDTTGADGDNFLAVKVTYWLSVH